MTMRTQAMVAPNGFWIKTHFFQEGNLLKAKSYMVVAGDPIVFEVSVNLAYVEKAIRNYHARLHGTSLAKVSGEDYQISGCVGCDLAVSGTDDVIIGSFLKNIKKAVKKVGSSKLVNKVAKVGRKVIKSKITAGIVGAVAVAFPAVGAPAAAALAAANVALAMIDKAKAAKKTAASIVSKAKAVGQTVKLLPKTKAVLAKTLKNEKAAKAKITTLINTAKYSPNPAQKADAARVVAVLNTAAKARAKIAQIPAKAAQTSVTARALISKPSAVATGLVVDDRGLIRHGRFNEVPTGNIRGGLLYQRGKPVSGNWEQISGDCIGCTNPFPGLR